MSGDWIDRVDANSPNQEVKETEITARCDKDHGKSEQMPLLIASRPRFRSTEHFAKA